MTTKQTVLDFFQADSEEQAKHYIYKYTDCGAWLEFHDWGIVIGSIVEGCDFGTATYPLRYANNFTGADIQARIDAVEREADALWHWCNTETYEGMTNAEQGIDAPDIDFEYRHFEQGERSS